MTGLPSAASVPSKAASASSKPCLALLSLLVTNTSAGSMPTARDGLADPLLVAVHLRGVDVPVPGPQRLGHRLGGVFRRDLEHAETQLRDLDAIVQLDGRHGAHRASLHSPHGCLTIR